MFPRASTAHEYYLKYDVNPTLVRILTDMYDIYMTSYVDCEQAIVDEMNSCLGELVHAGAEGSGVLPQCTNESIASLLGGGLKVLLDCRFAMTEAVAGRHAAEMAPLVAGVVTRLQQLLLKLMRVLKLLPPLQPQLLVSPHDRGGESGMCASSGECVLLLKQEYAQLLVAARPLPVSGCSGPAADAHAVSVGSCQALYVILDRLNSISFLKRFLLIN